MRRDSKSPRCTENTTRLPEKFPGPPRRSAPFSLRDQRLKNFETVKFSSEIELIYLEKQCSWLFRGVFVVFFRGFSVALVVGKVYAYSPWKSLLMKVKIVGR